MKIAIIGNVDKEGLPDAVGLLLHKLEGSRIEYVIDAQLVELLAAKGMKVPASRVRELSLCVRECDIVVAFGGDGTILAVARTVGELQKPILGINLGKLGFLAELAPEDIDQEIGELLAGKYVVEERLVLQAKSPSLPGKVYHAVNDIVVDKSRSSRMINVETHIDSAFAVTFRGDGLIISTPTGSTAYALSNGGPIVMPTSGVIGITPIAPHSLSGRPVIVPDTSMIRVKVRAEADEVLLSCDGQQISFFNPPVEVLIQRAPYALRLVKRTNRSYFDVLRAKLLWGGDTRG